MSSALEEVAAAADEVADDQRRVARRARAIQRERDRGRSWVSILDREAIPGILELLRRSRGRLNEATSRLARAIAGGLSEEGASRRQIGRRLGVSHQRVSAMLNDEHEPESNHGVSTGR